MAAESILASESAFEEARKARRRDLTLLVEEFKPFAGGNFQCCCNGMLQVPQMLRGRNLSSMGLCVCAKILCFTYRRERGTETLEWKHIRSVCTLCM